jgi:hypothetical protein
MLCIPLQASGVPRVEKIQKAIEIVRLLSENGKLKDRRGIALIEEIFELLPLDECELIFEYLEKRSSWLQKLGAELPPTVRGTGIHKLAPPIADSVSPLAYRTNFLCCKISCHEYQKEPMQISVGERCAWQDRWSPCTTSPLPTSMVTLMLPVSLSTTHLWKMMIYWLLKTRVCVP